MPARHTMTRARPTCAPARRAPQRAAQPGPISPLPLAARAAGGIFRRPSMPRSGQCRIAPSRRLGRGMNIEPLENRRLMAATIALSSFGTLTVNGTPDADTINMKAEKGKIRVEVLTHDATDPDELPSAVVWRRFDAKRVSHIIIDGGAGNDRANVKLPSFAGKVDFWGRGGNDAASLNVKGKAFLVG